MKLNGNKSSCPKKKSLQIRIKFQRKKHIDTSETRKGK